MRKNEPVFRNLMDIDMSLPLGLFVLVVCGVGFFYGTAAAFQTVLYGFVALFVIGMPLLLLYAQHAELDQLRDLQAFYGGTVSRGWFIRGPSLRFSHAGNAAEVRVIRCRQRHRPDDVQLSLEWPGPDIRLEIRPHGVLSRFGRLVGFQDIKLGRATFDERYVIQGNDPPTIRQLLTRDVQREIVDLPEQNSLVIRLSKNRFTVQAQHYALQSDLPSFIESGLRLYDALRESDRIA